MIEIIVFTEMIFAIGVYLFHYGKYRPLAWGNLLVSLILLPGSLVYGAFYPILNVDESLRYFLMFFSFLSALGWLLPVILIKYSEI